MGSEEQGSGTPGTGKFKPGVSGNPRGRPRKQRQDAREERRDGWVNAASGHGTARDRRILTQYDVDIVTDLEAVQLWRSQWLAARIIETIPSEAFRRGYEINLQDKKLSEQLATRVEELNLDTQFVTAAKYERAYGGAAIFPVLEGALDDLEEPLDESRITNVTAFHVLEPRELQPVSYYTELGSRKFRRPDKYRVQPLSTGRAPSSLNFQVVHESRLVIFPGLRVSHQTQPGQRESWGDSCLCRPNEVLRDYGLAWGSAATLLHEFGQGVLEMEGLAALLATAEGEALLAKRVDAMDIAKSTLRTTFIDGKDKFSRSSGTLGGLAEVLREFSQLMAAAADTPVTVLMGMSPAGMNATGDFDVRSWYGKVDNHRVTNYLAKLEQLLRLILIATDGPTGGKEPEVWSAEFRPLWQPSEKEQADTRKTNAETDAIYIENQVATPEDIAQSRFGGDTYSAETVIDWEARKAQQDLDVDLDAEATAALAGEVDPADPSGGKPSSGASLPAAAGDNVQVTVLNGAQVESLVDVVKAVTLKEIPRESAVQILMLAFQVSQQVATAVLGPENFAPPAVTPAPAPFPPAGSKPEPRPEAE